MRRIPAILGLGAALLAAAPSRAIDSASLEAALGNPAGWTSEAFTSLWKRDPAEAGAPVSHARLESPPDLLGLKPESVGATFAGESIHSISVVLLDAGTFFGFGNSALPAGESPEKARARFDEEFGLRKARALDGLKRLGGGLAIETGLSPRGGLKLRGAILSCGNGAARLLSYEHQLLMVSFHRSAAEARTILVQPLVPPRKPGERPSALDSFAPRGVASTPEHRTRPVPMIIQGNRGYCAVATLAMAANALGLSPGAEEMAAANSFAYGHETNPDIREMFAQVARESGVKAQRQNKFDLPLLKLSIDQGLPVVVFRWWNQERDYLHSVYSARVARGEKAELPQPGLDDRKSWPAKGGLAHASIINGYRDDRREIIFTESWGPQSRNRRMRYEEMDATCYYAVFFSK